MSKALCAAAVLAIALMSGSAAWAQSSGGSTSQSGSANSSGNPAGQPNTNTGTSGSQRTGTATPPTAPGAGKVDHQTGGQDPGVQPLPGR